MENVIFCTVAALNAKINEIKNKISNITNLFTATDFTVPENKIADQFRYINTPEFNTLTAEAFAARLSQENFLSKSYIANFVKNTDFDYKLKTLNKNVTSNKNKTCTF